MIQFDTGGLEQLIRDIDKFEKALEDGIYVFIELLDRKIHIDDILAKNIDKLVYSSKDPNWYERTGDLLRAVRLEKDGKNEIHLYMDDNWLGNRPQARGMKPSTGFDPSVHDGEGYSMNVEQGHYYINKDNGVARYRDWYTEPRPFMEETYEELVNKLDNGQIDAKVILKYLFQKWETLGKR